MFLSNQLYCVTSSYYINLDHYFDNVIQYNWFTRKYSLVDKYLFFFSILKIVSQFNTRCTRLSLNTYDERFFFLFFPQVIDEHLRESIDQLLNFSILNFPSLGNRASHYIVLFWSPNQKLWNPLLRNQPNQHIHNDKK